MGCFAPAGGVYSTIEDLAQFAGKMLDGSAPGLGSLEPLNGVSTDRASRFSGKFWTVDVDPATGRRLIWHTGGTGGYTGVMAFLPEFNHAVIVLANVGGHTAQMGRVATGLMESLRDAGSS
jgi:CubicO group peptidase (beta-lactamase class C family)